MLIVINKKMDFFGTEKYFQNRTYSQNQTVIETRSMKEWFMDEQNCDNVLSQLTHRGIQFNDLELRAKMGVWARKNKIHLQQSSDNYIIGHNDLTILLKSINAKFINETFGEFTSMDKPIDNRIRVQTYKNHTTGYKVNPNNDFNDVSESETVIQDGILMKSNFDEPDHEIFETKKSTMMTASDYKNLDVYDPKYDRDLYVQAIGMSMKRQRRNDLQKYMHKRHVYGFKESDSNPDGYRSAESDRASLDNLSRGFSMKKFIANANNLKRPESMYQFQF